MRDRQEQGDARLDATWWNIEAVFIIGDAVQYIFEEETKGNELVSRSDELAGSFNTHKVIERMKELIERYVIS